LKSSTAYKLVIFLLSLVVSRVESCEGQFFNPEERNGNRSINNREASLDSTLIDDVPSVWCLDCQENLVILGTGSGRLEIWDSNTGSLKVTT
jgi:hypothetical protein